MSWRDIIRNFSRTQERTEDIVPTEPQQEQDWNEEENTDRDRLTVSNTPQYSSSINVVYDDAVQNDTMLFVDNSGSISWADANLTIRTNIALRAGYEIAVDEPGNGLVSIGVDRNIYDIELLEDRIEIRRRFDDESNDDGAHDESTGDSVQRGEDVLQQWDAEQNSQG